LVIIDNLRILYVVNSSLASPTGGGRTRVIDVARQAKKHHHQAWILCFVRPEQWFNPNFLRFGKQRLEAEAGVPVIYIPRLPFIRFHSLNQLNAFYCGTIIRLFTKRHGIHIVHGHGIQPAWFALKGNNKHHYKVITDVHGLLYEEAAYSGKLREESAVARLYKDIEQNTLLKSDWVIFVSHSMQHYYQSANIKVRHAAIIPCAVDTHNDLDLSYRLSLRNQLVLENKIVFIYVGSAVSYQQVPKMCELFAQIRKHYSNAFFLILSHHIETFQKNLYSSGIDSKDYRIEAVEHGKVFEYLQAGDIGLLLRDNSPVNRVASPTKFGEYCFGGVPIITTPYAGDVSQIINDNNLGHVIDLELLKADTELFTFVDEVMNNREFYSKRCINFVQQNYSWDYFGDILSKIYSECAQSR
jgi:glycosyltransferase involved in cell wall biosynthesis